MCFPMAHRIFQEPTQLRANTCGFFHSRKRHTKTRKRWCLRARCSSARTCLRSGMSARCQETLRTCTYPNIKSQHSSGRCGATSIIRPSERPERVSPRFGLTTKWCIQSLTHSLRIPSCSLRDMQKLLKKRQRKRNCLGDFICLLLSVPVKAELAIVLGQTAIICTSGCAG